MACLNCDKPTGESKRRGRPKLYCSDYCRKQYKYGSICDACGGKVAYSGHAEQPKRCDPCARALIHKEAHERYMDAFHEWFDRYGEVPGAADWLYPYPSMAKRTAPSRRVVLDKRHKDRKWPVVSGILQFYGSWNEAVRQAGFEPMKTGHQRDYDRHKANVKAYAAKKARG